MPRWGDRPPTDEDLVAGLRAVANDRRLAEHIEHEVDPGIAACGRR
ncbi:MAG: hypothetical protein JKY37_07510 [Nannocystaceae bacterium]|nr:hypothetical protein [Nannocystaceae bacterium]